MTRHRTLSKRLKAVETLLAAVAAKPVPNIIFVRRWVGETSADARAQFDAAHPVRPRGHTPLIVPAKPRTDAEHAIYAERFREQQLRIAREARSRNAAVAAAEPAFAPNAVWSAPRMPKHSPKLWRPDARR